MILDPRYAAIACCKGMDGTTPCSHPWANVAMAELVRNYPPSYLAWDCLFCGLRALPSQTKWHLYDANGMPVGHACLQHLGTSGEARFRAESDQWLQALRDYARGKQEADRAK